MENWPIIVLMVMIATLFLTRLSMLTVCTISALVILVLSGSDGRELLSRAAPNIATVFVVMTVTQLSIRNMLQAGLGEHISLAVATFVAHRRLRRLPASVLLPAIFVPASMILAMFLHNITAILVLTPLAINLCVRYGVNPVPTMCGMLVGSNLGGASMAFGDTPAIIQREIWKFTPATFAAAMLPRNLLIVVLLTAVVCLLTWYPERRRKTGWIDILKRLQTRDNIATYTRFSAANRRQLYVGAGSLASFILLQFVLPTHTLVIGAAVFVALIVFTPRERHVEAYTALGLESIMVICSLFVVAASVEHTPVVHWLAERLKDNQEFGAIEIVAYLLTAAISADGAAATLAPLVHGVSEGSMLSAWQLASGICAGSSTLLTAASAGPVINSVSRNAGRELTFREYSRFGIGFSLVMAAVYLAFNLFAAG